MKTRGADLDVKLLLFAIQKTTTFEKFLSNRFVTSSYIESVSSTAHTLVIINIYNFCS